MRQELPGECELLDGGSDLGIEVVEASCEGGWCGAVAGQRGGQTGAQETIIGSGEKQSSAEAGFGDAVALGVGQALDHAVQAQAAELIGHGAGSEALRIATAEGGEMAAEIGSAKAGWKQAEQDHGMP